MRKIYLYNFILGAISLPSLIFLSLIVRSLWPIIYHLYVLLGGPSGTNQSGIQFATVGFFAVFMTLLIFWLPLFIIVFFLPVMYKQFKFVTSKISFLFFSFLWELHFQVDWGFYLPLWPFPKCTRISFDKSFQQSTQMASAHINGVKLCL